MTCAEFLDSLLAPGALTVRLRQSAHERRCPACRAVARGTRQIASALAELPRHQAPPEVAARLRAIAPEQAPARRPAGGALKWGVVAAAALTALLLALPRGSQRDALAQAVEGLKHAQTIHMLGFKHYEREPNVRSQVQIEVWAAGEDRYRQEEIEFWDHHDDVRITVRNGDRLWKWSKAQNLVEITRGPFRSPMEQVDAALLDPRTWLVRELEDAQREGDAHVTRKETFDGGKADVPRPVVEYYLGFAGAPQRFVSAVIDRASGRLLRCDEQVVRNGLLMPVWSVQTIDFDSPIPEERFAFRPPRGARVVVEDPQ